MSKRVISYLGYDRIDKEFKVLCMTKPYHSYPEEHQVLTLGAGKKLPWRIIECDVPHYPASTDNSPGHYVYDNICINGVLYYQSMVLHDGWSIVCFDVRSEKLKGIGIKAPAISNIILVNYKGKLATLQKIPICTDIQVWVLEDIKKHQWSSYTYVLPALWKNIFEETRFDSVGMSSRGGIVLSPKIISNSFYLLYYNPERNTITRVEIQGMEAFKHRKPCTFLDHVEDVKLMAAIKD